MMPLEKVYESLCTRDKRSPYYCCDEDSAAVDGGIEGEADETLAASVYVCDSCFQCHKPSPTCPFCGYVYLLRFRNVADSGCSCDMCFYGRDKLALEIIRLKELAGER